MDCITYKPLLYWIWSLVTFCISILSYSVNLLSRLNIRKELFILLIFCSILCSKSEFYQKYHWSKKCVISAKECVILTSKIFIKYTISQIVLLFDEILLSKKSLKNDHLGSKISPLTVFTRNMEKRYFSHE